MLCIYFMSLSTLMNKSRSFILFCLILFFTLNNLLFASDRPIVRDITVSNIKGSSIAVSWQLPRNPAPAIIELLLYRTNKEITTYGDLKDLTPLARLKSNATFYSDEVSDFLDYYYTVISVTNNGAYEVVMSAINSSVVGVHVKVKKQSVKAVTKATFIEKISNESMRAAPLPVLDIMGKKAQKEIIMSQKAHNVARDLGVNINNSKVMPLEVHIFEEDLTSAGGGDDFLLFETLRKTFVLCHYKEAADELLQFAKSGRSKETTQRAYFYLAESYYYSGDYKTAVRYFLKVYDVWPKLVKERIDSSLALYNI